MRRGAGLRRIELPDAGKGAALPEPEAVVNVYFDGTGAAQEQRQGGEMQGGGAGAGAGAGAGRRGWQPTPVYLLRSMPHGPRIPGPAMLRDETSTVVVDPGFEARITKHGDVRMDAVRGPIPVSTRVTSEASAMVTPDPIPGPDPILLSVYGHRFMSIAEQMGRTLQRTSISVNIKERLDFSCALFGPDGGLVANAPHIPVHLGAMQEAVRFQLKHWCGDGDGDGDGDSELEGLSDGDVLLSNHPQLAGGSHLPDITVITPVFAIPGASTAQGDAPAFFVASRGHHADIGGITPGSMPPLSTLLSEEGAAIVAFKLVRGPGASSGAKYAADRARSTSKKEDEDEDEDGTTGFQEAAMLRLLAAPGEQGIAGCVGCRNTHDVMSDLKAQVAANHKGIELVRSLMMESGAGEVEVYMGHIQDAAEAAVQGVLARQLEVHGTAVHGGEMEKVEDESNDGATGAAQ